jgi:acetyl/propionyl-CoA carboxylase alpha subunit
MRRALAEFTVVGVETNIPFHLQVLSDARFLAGELSTTFLESFSMSGRARDGDERVALLAAALLTHLKRRRAGPAAAAAPPADGSGWRAAGRVASLSSGAARGRGWRSIG